MKVGDKVWKFQSYRRKAFRDAWDEFAIIGENRVSWLIGYSDSTREIDRLNQ